MTWMRLRLAPSLLVVTPGSICCITRRVGKLTSTDAAPMCMSKHAPSESQKLTRCLLQDCTAQAVANTLWAIAKLSMGQQMQPPVLHTLLEASAQRMLALLPSASPQVRIYSFEGPEHTSMIDHGFLTLHNIFPLSVLAGPR